MYNVYIMCIIFYRNIHLKKRFREEIKIIIMADPNPKGMSTHIPVLIFLQICFIILFGAFTR